MRRDRPVAKGGLLGAVLLCAAAAGPALAAPGGKGEVLQAPAAAEGPAPEVVVTASRADLLGAAVTASQGEVTREELELRPAFRIGQLLETVPGLVVTIHSGEGKAYQYLLRGFNLDHGTDIANFIDDVPINRPTNAHGQGYSDLNFVIPEVLDGVEFTKGTYYPAVGDFGDVASEHMRIARRIPTQMSASVDTFGDFEGYAGGSHALMSGARILGAVDLSRVDGPFTPGNAFRKTAAIVRVSRGAAADGGDLTVMYYKGDGNFITDEPVRAVTDHRIGRFGALDPTDGNVSERFSVSGHEAGARGPFRFTSNAYYVRSRQTLWNDFTHFLEDQVNGDQEQQDESRTLAGGGAALSHETAGGGMEARTTIGVQGRYDDIYVDRRHTKARRDLNYCELLNADGTATPVSVGAPNCTADRVQLGDVGLYVESSVRWTTWLRTDLGVREEYVAGQDRSLQSGSPFLRSPYRKEATLFQPKGGVVLGPFARTEFYLSAGRGFHSDDLRGVSGTVPLEGLGGTRAAPLLIKADGEEIGVRTNVIPKVHVQIAAFNIRLNSEIVYDQDQGEDQPGPPSDRYGVEISAQYRPFSWLEFNTDLSFSHARFVQTSSADLLATYGETGRHIPLAPGFIGSVGALVDNLGPWFGGLEVRALGAYPLVSDNSQRDGGYVETNLTAGYRFTGALKAQVSVFNLFDVRADAAGFYYATDILDGRGAVLDHQFHPLEPIAARFTVTATF